MSIQEDNIAIAEVSQNEYDIELQSLAQLLSDLSIYSEHTPNNVADIVSYTDFVATSSNFLDNTWINLILNIQGWLGLDASLNSDDDPTVIVESLFSQIPPRKTSNCFEIEDEGIIILTSEGIDRISAKIEKALNLKETFIEAIEDGKSIKEANKEWDEAWDEENAQTKRYVSNINAQVSTWRIETFKNMASKGQFDLNPSYQRDVVWSNKDSSTLIESILRGIPLPSVIFSQGKDRNYQIVDGKQRLTSILRFIGEHPEGKEYIKKLGGDITTFLKNFPSFFRKHRISVKEQNEKFLPFKLVRFPEGDPLHPLSSKYYTDIKDEVIQIGNEKIAVSELFESPSCEYLIPTIIYKNTELQDIHHVFGLYNKQGKKLNAEELRNAAYHNLKLTRLLLVLSGDRTEPELFEDLVPFLNEDSLDLIPEVGSILETRGFGTARFKRTKVLSWTLSILLHPPNQNNGKFVHPSTAGHINSLLEAIQDKQGAHKLNEDSALRLLTKDTQSAVILHQEVMEAWPPSIRNKKAHEGKWEELPLVACLLGSIATVVVGEEDLLMDNIDRVRALLSKVVIPEKTQNKTQWQFIAFVALELITILGLSHEHIGKSLEERYGYNCIPTLQQIAEETFWHKSKKELNPLGEV
jgi:hypothetical protein